MLCSDVSGQVAQCCFLCLHGRKQPYAIQVPCIRPRPPKVVGHKLLMSDDGDTLSKVSGGEIYEPVNQKDKAFESDAAVWNRMKKMYFIDKGLWKRWLPFYGPTAVQEVKVWIDHNY